LIADYGSPRHSGTELAEILNFKLPSNVQVDEVANRSLFVEKTAGYLLRLGIEPRAVEKFPGFKPISRMMGSVVLGIHKRNFRTIIVGQGVGYFNAKSDYKNKLFIGYFQSYRWASNPKTYNCISSIHPIIETQELIMLKKLAALEKPLFVHVRLGDYLLEDSFGIPSNEYYEQAIRKHLEFRTYKSIWLFSDDVEAAYEMLPKEFHPIVRIIKEVTNPSQTLELMRHGSGYVIANSSFSWWGAFLAHDRTALVIAPNPWFAGMPDPREICPTAWFRISAYND
jgi:hypothetical protein